MLPSIHYSNHFIAFPNIHGQKGNNSFLACVCGEVSSSPWPEGVVCSELERLQVNFQRSPSLPWNHHSPPPSSSCGGCSSSGRPSSAPPSVPPQRCHCCCCLDSLRSGQFWTPCDEEGEVGRKATKKEKKEKRQQRKQRKKTACWGQNVNKSARYIWSSAQCTIQYICIMFYRCVSL